MQQKNKRRTSLIITVIVLLLLIFSAVNYLVTKNQLQKLQAKNDITCVQIDEYFNVKKKKKTFQKLELYPQVKEVQLSKRLSLHQYTYETSDITTYTTIIDLDNQKFIDVSPEQELFLWDSQVTADINLGLIDQPVIGIDDNWYVLSDDPCHYSNYSTKPAAECAYSLFELHAYGQQY